MGISTAYQCDGPGCPALTTRQKGKSYPDEWPRATHRTAGGIAKTGAFHSPECEIAWVTEQAKVPAVELPGMGSASSTALPKT